MPSADDSDDDVGQLGKAAAKQRLRRLCRRRANGKLAVPESVHLKYVAGGSERDQLLKLFMKGDCNREPSL